MANEESVPCQAVLRRYQDKLTRRSPEGGRGMILTSSTLFHGVSDVTEISLPPWGRGRFVDMPSIHVASSIVPSS